MAEIFGLPGKELGDKRTYDIFKVLSSDWLVYAQHKLVYKSEDSVPDYILVNKNFGVIVIEVKDWVQIKNVNKDGLYVYRTEKRIWEHESSPVDQAKNNAQMLHNMLSQDADLRNFAGKLDFAYSYAVILPNLFGALVNNCNYHWGQGRVIGSLDLTLQKIEGKISSIPFKWRVMMTDQQVRSVCAAIDGRNKIKNHQTGEFKGLFDTVQESLAKESLDSSLLSRDTVSKQQDIQLVNLFPEPEDHIKHLEGELPSQVINLRSNLNVRLVRGIAGTGKTDVLILRAVYLSELFPEKKFLVTTFNVDLCEHRLKPELIHLKNCIDVIRIDTLCFDVYKKRHGFVKSPQHVQGFIKHLSKQDSRIEKWSNDFLAEEFIWMKETGRTTYEKYVMSSRDGRGRESGQVLSRKKKEEIFEIFTVYQNELIESTNFDWVDLHEKVYRYLEDGIQPDQTYDAILIDEAQHFAPTWMKIITHFLAPGGQLFICDDPSQSVYRYYSWRQKGIDVVGKTRWLRINYRNTKEIFEAAFSLIANDPLAKNLLSEDGGYTLPDLSSSFIRKGNKPIAKLVEDTHAEEDFIKREIDYLVQEGLREEEICIMHTQDYVLSQYKKLFVSRKILVKKATNETGMEFSAVFIPQLQKFFERSVGTDWGDDLSKMHMLGFMCMTRARSYLYMTYQQKWPKALDEVRDLVDWVIPMSRKLRWEFPCYF